MTDQAGRLPNTVENLRQLLLELYVSATINPPDGVSDAERERLLDLVVDAAEGRPFAPLGLPFPRIED